jgi:hypothetical protein
MTDCNRLGEYRAPKAPDALRDYWWFCLDHVRAYNLAWDFYRGMTPGQIEAELRADVAWQRPSWPLGQMGGTHANEDMLRDLAATRAGRVPRQPTVTAPPELRAPLATLGLDWPTTLAAVKTRYKELAKRHHPDANGGDKLAEERLKVINLAYAAVRARLAGHDLAAAG